MFRVVSTDFRREIGVRLRLSRLRADFGAACIAALLVSIVAVPSARATVARWKPVAGGPPAREFSAMAYGAGKIVVFGGRNGTTEFDDTWLWDGAQWAQVALNDPNRPTPRYGAAMAFDESTKMFVLFGGTRTGNAPVAGRTYRFDPNVRQWSDEGPGGPARFHHALAYYPPTSTVVAFGGLGGMANPVAPDLFEWNGATWTVIPTTGGATLARSHHALVYDPTQGLVLYGGQVGGNARDDARILNNGVWTQLSTAWTGTARSGHAMVFDVNQGRSIIYGGRNPALLSSIFLSNGAAATILGSVTVQPSARAGHAAVYDPDRMLVVVVGGASSGGVVADSTWEFMMTGQPCTSGAECSTAICATGVCCLTPCDPPCRDCDRLNTALDPTAVDGECRLVTGKDPRFCVFDPGCDGTCSEVATCIFPGAATSCGLCLACNDKNGKCDQMPLSQDDPNCETLPNKSFRSCDPANVSCRSYDVPKTLHRCLDVGKCGWRWSDCVDYLANSCGECK